MNQNSNVLRRDKRRKFAAPMGIVFAVLALIGLIAVGAVATGWVRSLLDDTDKMKRYETFITPVVMMDPVPFNDIRNIDEQLLLQTALWGALLDEKSAGYSYDENAMLLVPSTDLDVAATKLFGPTIALNHRTFDDYEATYLFDPELSAYRVPLIAKVAYSPSVELATNTPNGVTLKVGYIAPGNIWSTNIQEKTVDGSVPADKYMLYDMVKGDDSYYIKAVRDVENGIPPRS